MWGLDELIHIKDLRIIGTYRHLVLAITIAVIKTSGIGVNLRNQSFPPNSACQESGPIHSGLSVSFNVWEKWLKPT